MRPEINNRPIIGRLFGADNRPADNRLKHYRCTSSLNVGAENAGVVDLHQFETAALRLSGLVS